MELRDPLMIIAQERGSQRKVCDDLEQIADQLGGLVDQGLCRSVLSRLSKDLPLYHKDEEVLFDVLRSRDECDVFVQKCIGIAVEEHSSNEFLLFDIAEPLGALSEGGDVRNIHVLGYMLRCCFQGIRRHLDWEDATLLGERLISFRSAEIEALRTGLARNRRSIAQGPHIA